MLWYADDPKEKIEESLFNRSQEFKARRKSQIQTVDFPTTTIGSFPQTAGACSCRAVSAPIDSKGVWRMACLMLIGP